jgi:hypothetical protein
MTTDQPVEAEETLVAEPDVEADALVVAPAQASRLESGPVPQTQVGELVDTIRYVYALGRVEPRFPRLAVEKEFAQATGRSETAGLTDGEALQDVLLKPENRYLARQLCWTLTIEGLETYLLVIRDPSDLDRLVAAVRATPRPTDVDVIVGIRGPLASPDMCNGLVLPIVAVDQIWSFDVDALVKSIPKPRGIAAKEFESASEELFLRVMQIADNAGSTDEHRALNYLAVRYPAIYAAAANAFARDATLTAIDVVPSRLSGARTIVDVIFSYRDRATDVVDKQFVRVDITEEFPFLVTKLSPYFDR